MIDAQVPEKLVGFVNQFRSWRNQLFIAAVVLFLLVLGAILDIFSALVLVVPLILPVASSIRRRSGTFGDRISVHDAAGVPDTADRSQSVYFQLSFRPVHCESISCDISVSYYADVFSIADYVLAGSVTGITGALTALLHRRGNSHGDQIPTGIDDVLHGVGGCRA